MTELRGIEGVDPRELESQRALTAALWSTLKEQGVIDGTPGRIECYFFAKSDAHVTALVAAFPRWEREIANSDNPLGRLSVHIISPPVHLSKEAFLELVDVAMIAAHESSCIFDGFQVDTSALQKRRWWKFW
ncbi:hypothetical protein IVB30_41080 [Bradyrhizobium sp. 200]|uniref:hypothetical protein n=1 Tax=Bradyrhizobium sp. 200 TaxID=2782665 RepID=UPI001FFF6883|nr:hypothetical protein [Bradyrhizobium sp. 200]UPJ49270.1 hypothetical protein IVB30_41080 [Bradyrhizobium sp. 200]